MQTIAVAKFSKAQSSEPKTSKHSLLGNPPRSRHGRRLCLESNCTYTAIPVM